MSRIVVIVALLLFTGLGGGDAAAGESPKKLSKKVSKLNAYLEKVGINNPRILSLTQTVQARTEGDYLRIAEERLSYGRVVLFYEIEPRITSKQLQIKFQPNNSNAEFTLTPRSAMVTYQFSF